MTCIVGLIDDGDVIIGADSLSASDHKKQVVRNAKIIRLLKARANALPSDIIVGYTTSWRMGQLLRTLRVPKYAGDDTFDYITTLFVDAVREQLKNGGFASLKEGVESGGEFLMALDGRLFKVQSDYSVLESTDSHNATGSGEEWAMGSLHSTGNVRGLTPEQRIIMALNAAAAYSPGVQGPFYVERLASTAVVRAVA